MRVNDNRKQLKFNDLRLGDVFEDEHNNLCIKTAPVEEKGIAFDGWNAVDLEFGLCMKFLDGEEVTKLDAVLQINECVKSGDSVYFTFAKAFEWMRDGGKVTNKDWDSDMVAMLNDDGYLVDGCGDLFENLTTEEIFNDNWILIIN